MALSLIKTNSVTDDAITSAKIADGAIANADLADMAANTVKVRNANSSGVPSDLALATTQIMIGDGTGFTAAALSGDVTMTNAGAVTIANNAVDGGMIAMGSDAAGDVLYYNGTDYTRLAVGTAGQALKVNSGATAPEWAAIAGDIESVTAGTGLNGGGTSGDVTLNLDTTLPNDIVISTSGAITTTGAFTSIGIDDNADAVAITIDSSENVGIGQTVPLKKLHLKTSAVAGTITPKYDNAIVLETNSTAGINMFMNDLSEGGLNFGQTGGGNNDTQGEFIFSNYDNHFRWTTSESGGAAAEKMRLKSNGFLGIGITPTKQLHITKSATADITALADGATITPDLNAAQNFSVTLGGNRTLANPTNIVAGQTGSIFVTQDGTGGRTLSFGGYWDFIGGTAPTMTTTASAVDRIDYIVRTSTSIEAVVTLAYS